MLSLRQRLFDLEREHDVEREADELIKAQLQTHFESIQRISDSMTLPYAIHYLRCRISEELDLSQLTERLRQGKGHPNTITQKEKLELWERLKILSFTRTSLSLWAMTVLSLYIRVQVNILGRHLYINTARGLGSSQDENDPFDRHGQYEFLATADYLSNYGLTSLIQNMQRAATEVLKENQLGDPFNVPQLRKTIIQILKSFTSVGGPHHWMTYLLPENVIVYGQSAATSSNDFYGSSMLPDINRREQLMAETRAVLSSADFGNIMDISLKKVVDVLMEEIGLEERGGGPSSGIALAKLLPHVVQLGPQLLEEPSRNKFIQIIRSLPEVELFYTLLYANMPPFS
ncbi:peroxisome biogenesis protein 3-2-like isoform X2 [Tasmannia lanceolata]|uniref:peroxisome biogenesis protein 3-2-like isoform X2 n=1 Tax=Tasmannia lanceolata TaxID=3420 RepID=UPI004063CE40